VPAAEMRERITTSPWDSSDIYLSWQWGLSGASRLGL
jgi:hypothetical protein